MTSCDLALISNIPCTCLILQEYVQYGFISNVTKFELDLTYLPTFRAQSVPKHAPYVNNFDFDLTFDVIGDLDVNEIGFWSTVLAGPSNAF